MRFLPSPLPPAKGENAGRAARVGHGDGEDRRKRPGMGLPAAGRPGQSITKIIRTRDKVSQPIKIDTQFNKNHSKRPTSPYLSPKLQQIEINQ
jgi:hypothetical protein